MRALEMRDDLEKQVLGLSRQRDTLEADMGSMAAMQHNVKELAAEVRCGSGIYVWRTAVPLSHSDRQQIIHNDVWIFKKMTVSFFIVTRPVPF